MEDRKSKIGMFTIDLLNGQGLPLKSKPGGIAIVAVAAAIPLTIAIGMLSLYLNDKILVSINEQEIARWETEIGKLSDAVEQQEALEREKIAYSKSLAEVKSSINRHTQWSPILRTLIENMPDSVVLTELGVDYDSIKKQVPKKDDPHKIVEFDILIRTLRLIVSSGSQRNCDDAVRDFRDRLLSSAVLGPKLENIGVSQKSEALKGKDGVSYEISCLFKPEL
jgi:Tfp pilus assembly protein PilN